MAGKSAVSPRRGAAAPGDPALAARLRRELRGEVLFDAFDRGRYSTDASHYQIEPLGVVVPRDAEDVVRAVQIAAEHQVPLLPRGAGTSQCGQTVGAALVVDFSKHLDALVELDSAGHSAVVEPGLVLDRLNARLAPQGLWFAVDVSTASRATLGGMTGNNSCGARSLRYGTMRDNVLAVDAIGADGHRARYGPVDEDGGVAQALRAPLLELGRREATEIAARFPTLMRRVGGYNIDALVPSNERPVNLAHLLVGSEGTLAVSERIHLRLHPLPAHRTLGVCHFPTFYAAMDAAQHIVRLGPSAVELVDRTMLELSRDIALYRATVEQFVHGRPDAVLLVEFAGEDRATQVRDLGRLSELMGDLGLPDSVVEIVDPVQQKALWEVRKAGLNIMMSMKGDGKPVSFIEDCAVRLEDLAEYTDRLTRVFARHGTTGTWYAHASVGCLHVRPVLNLKLDQDAKTMRAIAEEAFEMVREYKGSHSGEHGDGLVRSEFHQAMFGQRMVQNFAEVKRLFDPGGRMNPGKIVDPPPMDQRTLFRFPPGYRTAAPETVLDWSDWHGFAGAVEMCNNNGACRKLAGGVMCPSYRVTRNERDLTRGRANTLRLALSGQLGAEALTGPLMQDTMRLCVGCKACRRECPTGVDMAKMKLELAALKARERGLSLHEHLVAWLPRYAPYAHRLRGLLALRERVPGLAAALERPTGFSRRRALPRWHPRPYLPGRADGAAQGREVVLFADTFNTWFEADNLAAARDVLLAAGERVLTPAAADGRRPLCCGRTFLSVGLAEQARAEARRLVATLLPLVERGAAIVGLEPSCLYTLRDELPLLLPGAASRAIAAAARLFEEYLDEHQPALDLQSLDTPLLLHGHCHQKAFAAMGAVERVLRRIPQVQLQIVDSSCCGMAGAFGYARDTSEVSLQMAELDLLPAIRRAGASTLVVADGTSCRAQIADGAQRQALHVARVLRRALASA